MDTGVGRLDIGSTLQGARVSRGWTVPDLVQRTRISKDVIEAIERNDFSRCGGDVFARGHVRSIAVALGLDPAEFLTAMGASAEASALSSVEPESLNIWELRERAIVPSERRVWGAIALVGVVIVAALLWYSRSSAVDSSLNADQLPSVTPTGTATVTAEPTAETQPTTSAEPSTSEATSAPTPPQETADTVVQGAIVMQLACTQTSWVRVTNARGTLYEGTLRDGDIKVLSSDSDVTVRIGNAAGVSLTVNDSPYAGLGGPGEVYTHTFTVG